MMVSEAAIIERYDTATFADGLGGVALRSLPPGEPERLAQRFCQIDPWRRLSFTAEGLGRFLAAVERGAPRYAIMSGHEVAGCIALRLNWLRGPYLQFIGVLPEFQGRQLGSAVLTWLAGEARRNGERNVWVCCSALNEDALKLYARHGFERVAGLDDLVAPGAVEFLLRRRL